MRCKLTVENLKLYIPHWMDCHRVMANLRYGETLTMSDRKIKANKKHTHFRVWFTKGS